MQWQTTTDAKAKDHWERDCVLSYSGYPSNFACGAYSAPAIIGNMPLLGARQ